MIKSVPWRMIWLELLERQSGGRPDGALGVRLREVNGPN